MTRLPYADPAEVASDIAGALSALPDLHLFGVVGHAETAFLPWLGLGGALLSSLSLDPALRELVILQVATSTDSDYERVQHEAIATGVGVSVEAVKAVVTGALDAPELAESSPVLRVVDELVRTHRTSEAGMGALRSRLGVRASVEQHQAVAKQRADARGPAARGRQDLVGVEVHLSCGLRGEDGDLTAPEDADLEDVSVLGLHAGHEPPSVA